MNIPPITKIKSMEDALRLAGKMNNFVPDEKLVSMEKVNIVKQLERYEESLNKLDFKA